MDKLISHAPDLGKNLSALLRHRLLVASGVVYTVVWSFLLYFGWQDSPAIITWCDLVTGIILLQMAYEIYGDARSLEPAASSGWPGWLVWCMPAYGQ